MDSSTSHNAMRDQATEAEAGAGVDNAVNSHAAPNAVTVADPVLPPLSPEDFAVYNRLAEKMDYFVCDTLLSPKLTISQY